MSDIYLSLTETPTVVTLSQPVVSGALSSNVTVTNVVSVNVVTMPAINVTAAAPAVTTVAGSVTVGNVVTVALDANSLAALESVTVTVGNVTIGSAVTIAGFSTSSLPPSTVTVANSVTVAGTVTANVSILDPNTGNNIVFSEDGGIMPNYGFQVGFVESGDYRLAGESYPFPISGTVTALPQTGNVTEASTKTITTGGTHQQVFAANANRKFLLVQNVSDTDMNLGIGYNPTASTGIFLAKSGSGIVFESGFIPTQEIRILCATTGKAFVALEG